MKAIAVIRQLTFGEIVSIAVVAMVPVLLLYALLA
ncbi:hypothetical protein Thiowin_00534 [Thiorhodovibrio winogradskyi]|uniref:Uncharacterized protein n=1 Tax=Thiorhodovibrio winogradskyi TaxID=77007 RepID=A0ABZ0S5U1_9GAMM